MRLKFNDIYGSETWAVNSEQEAKLERAEMRMVRWIYGVSLREKKTNAEMDGACIEEGGE